ncbi:MAG: PilZ domain-containing protein [Candidatus Omnitrophica bacterium]|nr:PilZ domain-containing protein [Candidatus Omnitrophota bacterium]
MKFFGSEPKKNPVNNTDDRQTGEERRKHRRISKNYILTYFDPDDPKQEHEITQLRNISKGGMCFITTKALHPQQIIVIDLKTPYLSDPTRLKAEVLQSHEKVKEILYETRVQFTLLDAKAEYLIEEMESLFEPGEE